MTVIPVPSFAGDYVRPPACPEAVRIDRCSAYIPNAGPNRRSAPEPRSLWVFRSLAGTRIGVGTALAVLIDASIIRAPLVPSLMQLLGRWNWWAPKPLRRLHDRIGLREPERPLGAPRPARA